MGPPLILHLFEVKITVVVVVVLVVVVTSSSIFERERERTGQVAFRVQQVQANSLTVLASRVLHTARHTVVAVYTCFELITLPIHQCHWPQPHHY